MIARFFIDRPIFATVISIIIVIAGLVSLYTLPVAQYPSILPTDITISTNYPGASAEVIASSVAAPLEEQINGVDNMIYMTSNSSNSGQLSITVTFAVGTNPAQAEIDVNNRVQAALASLPSIVRQYGVTVSRRSGTILEAITLFSPDERYTPLYLSNYALLSIVDELKRINGVGDATLFGASNYAMRIWLYPDKMSQYNITPLDVQKAILDQNAQFAVGQFAQNPVSKAVDFNYTITTQGRFSDPKEFEEIIITANNNGSTLRIKDIARVELGAQDYSFSSAFNNEPAVAIGIFLQDGANALATAQLVKEKMEELAKLFPEGLSYEIPFDTTKFVRASIIEVSKTFAEAICLVMLVIYLFLQNYRATFIPLLAVPVSIIGTFSGMYILGFSINLLTLFGLILAIGIVVDDAIVVLENVERVMRQEKVTPRQAAIKAMEEVSGPIVAIVLSLCAVFIPVAFIGGLTGIIYKQFAITIVVSVVLSGIVALTLTPSLCAHFLRQERQETSPMFAKFNKWFANMTQRFVNAASFFIKHAALGVTCFALIATTAFMVLRHMPTGLVPEEDQGYIFAVTNLMPSSSLSRTEEATKDYNALLLKDPTVAGILSLRGFDLLGGGRKTNTSANFIMLKDWSERTKPEDDARALIKRFIGLGSKLPDALVAAFNPPPITGMSRTGGFEAYLQYKGKEENSPELLKEALHTLITASQRRPELTAVQTTFSSSSPHYYIEVDQVKTQALQVSNSNLFATLSSTFGAAYVNDFNLYNRTYRVYVQSDEKWRYQPDDLRYIFVRSNDGVLIPVSSLVKVHKTVGSDVIDRFNIFPAAKILGSAASGYSSGQAITAMEEVTKEVLSKDFAISWIGAAYQQEVTSSSGTVGFMFGVIMVFLILAALYERWALPFVVITAVPFAVLGAVSLALMRNLNNDVYFQIGLITLVGLSAKNAILIVEFATLEQKRGVALVQAVLTAARLRFRPIIMTSFAFILGCLPLYFSTGAGASSRHSIGTGVVGGMLMATFISVLFIPMFFKLINQLSCSITKNTPLSESKLVQPKSRYRTTRRGNNAQEK